MIAIILIFLWVVFTTWAMSIFEYRDVRPSSKRLFVSVCPIIHVWFCIKFTKWKNLKNIFNEDLFKD